MAIFGTATFTRLTFRDNTGGSSLHRMYEVVRASSMDALLAEAEELGVEKLFGDAAKLGDSWWADALLAAWELADDAARARAIAKLDKSARWLEEGEEVEVADERGFFSREKKRVERDEYGLRVR